MNRRFKRILQLAPAVLLFIAFAGYTGLGSGDKERKPFKRKPNVIFIVMDTVRADHSSLCGYSIPTTPNLTHLAHQDGASYTCNAITPGSWTLPSHASFFTGVDPSVHGAHCIQGIDGSVVGWGSHNRNLSNAIPTLAEKMAKRGFLTALFSANPVISDAFGLVRGFQEKEVAKDWYAYFGDSFIPRFEQFMHTLAKDKPLFLFINIADAHQPWQPVPKGISWASPAPRFAYPKSNPAGFWRTFIEGRATSEAAAAGLKKVTEQYDYAVWTADQNLKRTVDLLKENNWCIFGCRFIVVSDHGEFLGEHRLLDHGHYVYEPGVRVSLAAWGGKEQIKFPDPVSATEVFHLVQSGKLSKKQIPVTSMAWPHTRRCYHTGGKAFCSTSAALWSGREKLLFMDDKYYKIDLSKDPGENFPVEISDHPLLSSLKTIAERVLKSRADTSKEVDMEVLEQLHRLGYLN